MIAPGLAAPAAAPLVTFKGLEKFFANGTRALRDFNLTIDRGTFLSLVGPSGCGKSTVLKMLVGLAKPSSGHITCDGDFDKEHSDGGISYVFQDATLMAWCTVLDNVMLPLQLSGVPKAQAVPWALDALQTVGLSEFARAYPRELSGGMKMRVSLARAIVTRPKVLLLDEPFGALDEITRFGLNNDLLRLWSAQRFTTVFVTHSISEAVYLSQRVCVMAPRPGRIIADETIDIPVEERTPAVRTSPSYADYVSRISRCLEQAMVA
jgi:NitT/TauT family transport system ATP-binding protein